MHSVSFIWFDYVQKFWSGHKFPHCAMFRSWEVVTYFFFKYIYIDRNNEKEKIKNLNIWLFENFLQC